MCDISNPTKYKTKVVYKVVFLYKGIYYSSCALVPVTVGKVLPQSKIDKQREIKNFEAQEYSPSNRFYNKLMIGKCSGFGKLSSAKILAAEIKDGSHHYLIHDLVRILKIKLSGEILQGTSKQICSNVNWNDPTFAGTKILSIEEVK